MDKVLVMGIGNLLLTDDGVGVHAAQTLAGESWPENVTIMEAGTFTQDVFYLFKGFAHVLILDIVHGHAGPGTVYHLTENQLVDNEKQRLSIARAMLKDAPIVILDEATASVDPENEAELQAAISSLTKGKTLILIAHRLKTVRNADQILVLNGGHIVQRGTHEELIAQSGLYADFVHVRAQANSWKLEA